PPEEKHCRRATAAGSEAGPAGSQQSSRVPGIEQRAFVRYACNVDSACRRSPSIHPGDEHQDVWEATVQDLSVRGAGLVINRRFEIGATVTLEFRSTGPEPQLRFNMSVP